MTKPVLVPFRDLEDCPPYEEALHAAKIDGVWKIAEEVTTLDGYAGLLLVGGSDVNPRTFGEEPVPETDVPDDVRDQAELRLITEAFRRNVPVFAICRGLQILNVHQGGTLIQHLSPTERHRVRTEDRGLAAHPVALEPGTLLAKIAKPQTTWQVNSRHHQAVAKLGAGLRVCARDSDDGIIEAFDVPAQSFALAVQWHPENQILCHPEQFKLFQAFAAAL